MERHGFHSSWQIGNWPPDELAAVDRIEAEIVAHVAAYGQLDDMVRESAMSLVFDPSTADDIPVPSWACLPFTIQLR